MMMNGGIIGEADKSKKQELRVWQQNSRCKAKEKYFDAKS
jgi:hypothetical protein